MSDELIERLERETGQRIDDNGGDNNAMAGLLGAMSRELGMSPGLRERDDSEVVGIKMLGFIKMLHKWIGTTIDLNNEDDVRMIQRFVKDGQHVLLCRNVEDGADVLGKDGFEVWG